MRDGGLTAARRPHDAQYLAGAHLEVDVLERRRALSPSAVRERHVLETQDTLQRLRRPCARTVGNVWLEVQYLEQARAASRSARDRVDQPRDLPDGLLQDGEKREKSGELSHADVTGDNARAAHPQHCAHGQEEHESGGGGAGNEDRDAPVRNA